MLFIHVFDAELSAIQTLNSKNFDSGRCSIDLFGKPSQELLGCTHRTHRDTPRIIHIGVYTSRGIQTLDCRVSTKPAIIQPPSSEPARRACRTCRLFVQTHWVNVRLHRLPRSHRISLERERENTIVLMHGLLPIEFPFETFHSSNANKPLRFETICGKFHEYD